MTEESGKAVIQSTETKEHLSVGKVPEASITSENEELSRKRTRDDFEDNEESNSEVSERPIAPLKKRKDVDDSKQGESKKEEKNSNGSTEPTEETTKNESEVEEVKLNDTAEKVKNSNKEDPKQEQTKPKFVFGSTTAFGAGGAFSMISTSKNVFSSTPSANTAPKPSSESSAPIFGSSVPSSGGAVFGSASKFGNAFQNAISKESIFDKKTETAETTGGDDDEEKENSSNASLYKQVDLEKQDIKSGEENEKQVFTCRSKLYALDLTDVSQGWKERGVGTLHVNKSLTEDSKSRVIMRSNGLLKVILNAALVEGLDVVKGMPSSLSSEKFIRFTSVENGKPVQYALKTGKVETRDELFNAITALIRQNV